MKMAWQWSDSSTIEIMIWIEEFHLRIYKGKLGHLGKSSRSKYNVVFNQSFSKGHQTTCLWQHHDSKDKVKTAHMPIPSVSKSTWYLPWLTPLLMVKKMVKVLFLVMTWPFFIGNCKHLSGKKKYLWILFLWHTAPSAHWNQYKLTKDTKLLELRQHPRSLGPWFIEWGKMIRRTNASVKRT